MTKLSNSSSKGVASRYGILAKGIYECTIGWSFHRRVHSTLDAPAFFLLPFDSGTHFVIQLDSPLLSSSSLNSLTTRSSCIYLGARAISALTSYAKEHGVPLLVCASTPSKSLCPPSFLWDVRRQRRKLRYATMPRPNSI